MNAAASTNRRWCRLVVTRNLNTAVTLMNLIDEVSAADRDTVTVGDACRDEHAACIERLGANRSRLELFGLDVLPDDELAVGAVDDRLPADNYTGNFVPELRG